MTLAPALRTVNVKTASVTPANADALVTLANATRANARNDVSRHALRRK